MSGPEARIAFVVPRYGSTVVGGAESLCRALAANLTNAGTTVDVLTTCAVDHFTWLDELPAGESLDNGVRVRRFPVGSRDPEVFAVRHAAVDSGVKLTYGEQVEWMANSVWAPGMITAMAGYDVLVATPYLFGTTFWAVAAHAERTVVLPCLHDESPARQAVVLDSLCAARGVMLNAEGEGDLLRRLLASHRQGTVALQAEPHVVGCGFAASDPPPPGAVARFCARSGTKPGYLLYAGRRESAKGVLELYDHYRRYREIVPQPRPLALMGTGDAAPPDDIRRHVIDLGFVTPADKPLAFAGASVLVQPSRLESFGMVLFEAWLAGTPVLVNGESAVLRRHCQVSGGGLWYSDAASFAEALALMAHDPMIADSLAAAGREYTVMDYGWPAVRQRFHAAVGEWF